MLQIALNMKIACLATAISKELQGRKSGHCLRIDYLSKSECRQACVELREISEEDVQSFVLDEFEDALTIPVDRAIELRNRKMGRVCIFVPADLQDVAVSSLGNSFSVFPLSKFLKATVDDLRKTLDSPFAKYVDVVFRQLKGGASVSDEKKIEYLSSLHYDDSWEAIGTNLWRVGLIPDLRVDVEGFERSLELNRVCVEQLTRPKRPQSGQAERIVTLKLKPNTIQNQLARFLDGRRLTSDDSWLKSILDFPELTFDKWEFPSPIPSDLEELNVEPFHESGNLRPNTGLKQDAPGTIPYAPSGPRTKIKIKWTTEPSRPQNVAAWLVEMLPNPEDYPHIESDSIDLPKKQVKASSKTTTLPVDVGEDTLAVVQSVVVRIIALDEVGLELKNPVTGDTIYDVSQPFYLENGDEDDQLRTKRLPTDRCLADAYLKAATLTAAKELRHSHLPVVEKDLVYLPVQINDRIVSRMATSSILLKLEQDTIAATSTPVCFDGIASDIAPLTRGDVTMTPCDLEGKIDDKIWKDFTNARRRIFEHIKNQGCCSISTLHFSKDVCDAVVRLTKAYIALSDEILSLSASDPDAYREASLLLSKMDTLELQFPSRPTYDKVTIHMATHPARLLWLAAYSEWVYFIVEEVLQRPGHMRKRVFDIALLQYVTPENVPAWIARSDASSSVFVDNLQFVYGVSIPVATADPATLFSDTAWVLGFGEPESRLTAIEGPRLSEQIRRYRNLHPYASTLRICAVNTGNGSFLTSALLNAMRPAEADDSDERVPHLDLIHCLRKDDVVPRIESEKFLSEWQRYSFSAQGTQIQPSIQVALSQFDIDKGLPGGDVHLTTMLDGYKTNLVLYDQRLRSRESKLYGTGSMALFGLITKLESEFITQDGSVCWVHRLLLDGPQTAGDHPVRPTYTKLIHDVHERNVALATATLSDGGAHDLVAALCTELSSDDVRTMNYFHAASDWVLSVDRHFGIEFFDSPNNAHLGDQSKRYLLDYVPEFIEGLGHRQVMTTNWIDEVSQIMQSAMSQMGVLPNEANCIRLLSVLKSLSGRLAMRLASDDSLAQETVGLAIALAHLESTNALTDAIVVPLDAHKDFFLRAKQTDQVETASRCDILIVRGVKNKIKVDFIEVKSRKVLSTPYEELLDKISDQTHRTEELFRTTFFATNPAPDQSVQLCRLASMLRFYLQRAQRHGRIKGQDSMNILLDLIGRVETGQSKLVSNNRGIIVNIGGTQRGPVTHKETVITFLTGGEIEKSTGIAVVGIDDPVSHVNEPSSPVYPTDIDTDETDLSGPVNIHILHEKADETTVLNELRIVLGLDVRTENLVEYVGKVSGSPHLFILGIPGQGKSWTMQRIVNESNLHRIPSIILDFHGQFSTSNQQANSPINSLVFDASHGLPFSPFEVNASNGQRGWQANAFQVAEIIQHVCKLGDMQRDVVYEAVRDEYSASGFENDPTQLPTMADVFSRLQKYEKDRKGVSNVTARCRPLFDMGLFTDVPDSSALFSDAYKTGLVVDLHLLGLEVLQNAAGSFILRKLYKDMFSWGESDGIRLLVVLDEAHRLAKDVTLPKIMKEGRKFGIAVVVASQSLQDFHPEVLENAGTKISYRLNHPQNKQAGGFFNPRIPGEDIPSVLASLNVGQALVQTSAMKFAVKTDMTPLR